jgi:hypothetical protein
MKTTDYISDKIVAAMKRRQNPLPFSATDFASLGPRAAVGQALSRLAWNAESRTNTPCGFYQVRVGL